MKHFWRLAGVGLAVLSVSAGAAHWLVTARARLTPPILTEPFDANVEVDGKIRRWKRSVTTKLSGTTLAYLSGTPEQLGQAHSKLLRTNMLEVESRLYTRFERLVPLALARTLLLDAAQVTFQRVDRNFDPVRLREIAASAQGFQPDPFSTLFATYQRFVYLNALYDISLTFEHSPLLGCTTFSLGASPGGDPLLARVFDFDVDPVFDEEKVVFLVAEDGKIPFASVAWGGLIGVVSGMNLDGLGAVVHGARAGETTAEGEPVIMGLRRVLSETRSVREALHALEARPPMVSHLVVLADSSGQAAAVERIPGQPGHVRWLQGNSVVTNHFEGPNQGDVKNQRIRAATTTLPRRRRGEQLVQALSAAPVVDDAIRLLRDRSDTEGRPLPLGQREAINGLIAGHGIVFDLKKKTLWVSEPPHLLGRFLAFDLVALFSELPSIVPGEPIDSRPADPLLNSQEFTQWRQRHPQN